MKRWLTSLSTSGFLNGCYIRIGGTLLYLPSRLHQAAWCYQSPEAAPPNSPSTNTNLTCFLFPLPSLQAGPPRKMRRPCIQPSTTALQSCSWTRGFLVGAGPEPITCTGVMGIAYRGITDLSGYQWVISAGLISLPEERLGLRRSRRDVIRDKGDVGMVNRENSRLGLSVSTHLFIVDIAWSIPA